MPCHHLSLCICCWRDLDFAPFQGLEPRIGSGIVPAGVGLPCVHHGWLPEPQAASQAEGLTLACTNFLADAITRCRRVLAGDC